MGYNNDKYNRDEANKKAHRIRNLNLNPVNQHGGVHVNVKGREADKERKEVEEGLAEIDACETETETEPDENVTTDPIRQNDNDDE